MSTFRDKLTEALASHIIVSISGVVVRCSCGWVHEDRGVDVLSRYNDHRQHIADALMPVIDAEVEARVQAAGEQLDAIRAVLADYDYAAGAIYDIKQILDQPTPAPATVCGKPGCDAPHERAALDGAS